MKKSILLTAVLALIGAYHTEAEAYNFTNTYKFSENSPLASGKWVKLTTGECGVYELSYEELRELGFADPAKVSLFGEGGKRRSMSLVINGEIQQTENLTQVPVYHHGNKLYFYALGAQNLKFNGQFTYDRPNIYTDYGHYFLTDSAQPLLMEEYRPTEADQSSATATENALGYYLHEIDKMHGLNNAGQEFWEFYIDAADSKFSYSWPIKPAHIASGSMTADFNLLLANNCRNKMKFSLNSVEAEKSITSKTSDYKTFSMTGTYPGSGTVNLSIHGISGSSGDAYFNYFLLNYQKDISGLGSNLTQEVLGLPAASGATYLPSTGNYVAFDITNPLLPSVILSGSDKIVFPDRTDNHVVQIFNIEKSMKKILKSAPVANQNYHACKNDVPNFVIVTVPEYKTQAEQIAALHRTYLGQKVVVATTEELYNEFTSGNPDPIAIRMFGKMLYNSNSDIMKNILLIGPIRSDARNKMNNIMPDNFIIGVQEGSILLTRIPGLAMDVYGMIMDQVLDGNIYMTPMQIGVGSLPVSSNHEADIAVTKIKSYLERLKDPDMAYIANETLSISCTGDDHTHDNQVKEMVNRLNQHAESIGSKRFLNTMIMEDYYRNNDLASHFVNKINQGKLFSIYIGHASQSGLGTIIHSSDFMKQKNQTPYFMFFAGCDLTHPDYGGSGIGQDAVVRAHCGPIGSVISTRTAWSDGNSEMGYKMVRNLFYPSASATKVRAATTTLGEAYAATKNQLDGYNEISFIYCGDPALPFPIPLRKLELTLNTNRQSYRGGDIMNFTGTVRTNNNTLDAEYNGKVVFKLASPSVTLPMPGYESYNATFSDNTLLTVETEVKNGAFSVRIPVPEEINEYRPDNDDTANMHIYACSYSPSLQLTAAGYHSVPLAAVNAPEEPGYITENDTTAPTSSLVYNENIQILEINVSDDVAILPGIGTGASTQLYIDGMPINTIDVGERGATTSYSTTVCASQFSVGKHTAYLSVTDVSGNKAQNITKMFEVSDQLPLIEFEATPYAVDYAEFTVKDNSYNNLELVVVDKTGKQVYSAPFTQNTISWECPDIPYEIYRAAVRYINGHRLCSEWKTVTLID